MNLSQFFRILRARWLLMLITLLVTVGTTIAVSTMIPPRFTSTATIVVDFKGVDPVSGGIMPLGPMSGYLATQVDIIKSHNVARRVVDLLRLPESPGARELYMKETNGKGNIRDWLADLLLKELQVEPSRESTVVNVSYTGNDARFAAAIANAFVQSYMHTHLELQVSPARQTNTFFNEQIKPLQDNLERAQSRLSEYQRNKGIIATDERVDVETNRLYDLSSQLVAAQGQTYDAMARHRQVQDYVKRGQVADTLPDVLANPVIQSLKSSLTQLEVKQQDISVKLGKNHPTHIVTAAEIAEVKAKLLGEMKTISSTLGTAATLAQRREEQIRGSLSEQRAKVLQMKEVRDEQTVLLREMDGAQRAYDAAMNRMTQTKLESQTTHTNVMVINEAIEPIGPSSPKIFLNTALSLLLGLLLAIGFALVREMSDRIVRSRGDLTEALGVPIIGTLGRQPRRLLRGRLALPGGPAARGA